ncbi:cytochrome c oxidase subunit 3 [Niveispirillum sp. KHB5.9]|uniref:cytochrome c oxidase subunit 3 n=1 Tax=Niveispirillum sp. KHB5.9 TaxID=3400269 RepID=UPI003A882E6E
MYLPRAISAAGPATGGTDDADSTLADQAKIPGNVMMWIFIIGDLLVFSGLLIGFCVMKLLNRDAFVEGQSMLAVAPAILETFALIISGWLAAIAVERQRHGCRFKPALIGTMASGLLFLVFKIQEYAISIDRFDYEATFAQIYYLITGFHALHVALGLVLFSLSFLKSQQLYLADYARYWHFTDMIWLMIFPTLYIIR